MNPTLKKREYKARVWDEAKGANGLRVSIMAYRVEDAMEALEEKYGKGNVYDLHNEEDAERPR